MNLLIFVKMMQNCATQAAPETLVMLGVFWGFLACSQGQGLVPLTLENCTVTVFVKVLLIC